VEIEGLPGGGLIAAGLADLRAGRMTSKELPVAIGSNRLRAAGIAVPPWSSSQAPEHAPYEVLSAENADSAHGRYNALLRRLVSFERGLDHALATGTDAG
jgi:hypothetical protein